MKVTIRITDNFKKEAKPLLKKYHSLHKDLLNLHDTLLENPRLGIALGQNAFKIRLKINSKGKGKSGGARVITLVETEVTGIVSFDSNQITVNLLSIFDKGDVENISDKELKEIIATFKSK